MSNLNPHFDGPAVSESPHRHTCTCPLCSTDNAGTWEHHYIPLPDLEGTLVTESIPTWKDGV